MVAASVGSSPRARAEYLRYAAAEIVSIAPADNSESPRLLVRWDLPADLDLRHVDAAVVTMTVARTGEGPLGVQLHPVTRSWRAQEVSWAEGWEEDGGDFEAEVSSPAMVTERNGGRISIDVYLLIREMLAGTRSNFGFILVPDQGDASRLTPVAANQPARLADAKLIIAYRKPR